MSSAMNGQRPLEGNTARLEVLLSRVRELRGNLYPADWTADPLYMVEKELEDLLQELA